jgi:hypothetical protein
VYRGEAPRILLARVSWGNSPRVRKFHIGNTILLFVLLGTGPYLSLRGWGISRTMIGLSLSKFPAGRVISACLKSPCILLISLSKRLCHIFVSSNELNLLP